MFRLGGPNQGDSGLSRDEEKVPENNEFGGVRMVGVCTMEVAPATFKGSKGSEKKTSRYSGSHLSLPDMYRARWQDVAQEMERS